MIPRCKCARSPVVQLLWLHNTHLESEYSAPGKNDQEHQGPNRWRASVHQLVCYLLLIGMRQWVGRERSWRSLVWGKPLCHTAAQKDEQRKTSVPDGTRLVCYLRGHTGKPPACQQWSVMGVWEMCCWTHGDQLPAAAVPPMSGGSKTWFS